MTPADKFLRRLRENKLVSIAIVIGVVVIALANFKDALQKLGLPIFGRSQESAESKQLFARLNASPQFTKVSYRPLSQNLEDRFYHHLENLTSSGFALAPTEDSYVVEKPGVSKVVVPADKGLRYALVAVGNSSVEGLRGYLFDETGQLIDSESGDREVILKQSADYSGDLEFFVEVTAVDTIGQVNIAVGRRGSISGGPEKPDESDVGFEPTFNMKDSSPASSPTP